MFGAQILGDRMCNRCHTKTTVADIVQIVQIQQARVIFNPLTDIFTKCFSFCFILISLPLQDLNIVRKELKVIMEDPQNWCSWNTSFLWEAECWFSGGLLWCSQKFWIFSGTMPNDERYRPLWASTTLPVFWNLANKRWIVLPSGTLFLPKSFLHWALFDKIGRFFWTTLYIRKFSHESAKGFSVMSYGFILFRFHQTLTQFETIYSMQVWTLSGKVLKSLHKCERSISLIPRILVSKSMVKLFPEAAVAYIVQNSCS